MVTIPDPDKNVKNKVKDDAVLTELKQINTNIQKQQTTLEKSSANILSNEKLQSFEKLLQKIAENKNNNTTTSSVNKEILITKRAEILDIQKARLEAQIEREKILAQQADEDRAKRLVEEARRKNARDAKEASNYNPIARAASGIAHSQPSTFTQMLTAGLTGGIGNIFGLDKVLGAAGGFLWGKASSAIGKPFQARAQAKEQKAAEERAIKDAISKAELQQRIDQALKAKGLAPENASPNGNKKKKGDDDRTTASVEDRPDWHEQIDAKLEAIHQTLLGNANKDEEKKEEEDNFLMKMLTGIMGLAGKAVGLVTRLGEFLLGSLGKVLVSGLTAAAQVAAPLIAPAIALAVGGAVGYALAKGAVNKIAKNTNLLGDGTVQAQKQATAFINNANIKEYNERAGAYSGFSTMDTWIKAQESVATNGGKNKKAVEEFRRMRAVSASAALNEDGEEEFVAQIEASVKDKKLSRKEADELLIKKAMENAKAAREATKGKDIEQVRADNKARIEQRKQSLKTKQTTDSNTQAESDSQQKINELNAESLMVANEKDKEAIEESLEDVVSTEDAKILIKTDNMNLAAPTAVANANPNDIQDNTNIKANITQQDYLLPTESHPSEQSLLQRQMAMQHQEQMTQLQNNINNNTNNNGSNIYQTNITQHNDTSVYQTGDSARSMLAN